MRLRARALHPRRAATCAPSTGSSSRSTRRATSTATTTWSTGTPARARRSPTSRSRTARSRTRCTAIDYPVEGSDEVLTVATVRPETMLADTAVAVNPDDERYQALVGAALRPAAGRPPAAGHRRRARRPRVRHRGAEDHPRPRPERLRDRPRATGSRRSSVIGEDGRMTEAAGERFAGLTAEEAQGGGGRGAARARGCSAARSRTRTRCPFSHRSGERIEPLISLQWFCRMDELAKPAIEVVERDRGPDRPRAAEARLPRLDAEHPALVHLAPALVGAPAAGLVLRRLRGDLRRRDAARALRRLRRRAAPGRGRARHLVQLGAVAVRGARLARRDARSCAPSTRPTSWSRRATSSSSGSRGW